MERRFLSKKSSKKGLTRRPLFLVKVNRWYAPQKFGWHNQEFRCFLALRWRFYSLERRWLDQPFWHRRHIPVDQIYPCLPLQEISGSLPYAKLQNSSQKIGNQGIQTAVTSTI
jgi:hypothetical protein